MVKSHICVVCGTDCSGLRTPPDPFYGLPILVCPGCGAAAVHRPRLVAWRRRRPLALPMVLGLAACRLTALFALTVISIGAVLLATSLTDVARLRTSGTGAPTGGLTRAEALVFAGLILACTPVLLAVGLRWTLGHLSARRRILAWLGAVALLLWVIPTLALASRAFFTVSPQHHVNGTIRAEPVPFRPDLGHGMWPVALATLAGGVLLLNPIADRFGRYTAQQAWLSRLARARKLRRRLRS